MTPIQKKVTVVVAVAALVAVLVLMSSPLAALMSVAQALGYTFALGLIVGISRYTMAVIRGKRKADDDLPVRDLSSISDLHRWIALGGLVTVIGVACAGGLPWWGWMLLLSGIWVAIACAPSDLEGLSMNTFAYASIGAGAVGSTAAWIATHTPAESGSPLLAGSLIAAVPLLAVAGATRAVWGHQTEAQPVPAPVRLRAPAPAVDPEAEERRLAAFRARQQAAVDHEAAVRQAKLDAAEKDRAEREEVLAAARKRDEEIRQEKAGGRRVPMGQAYTPAAPQLTPKITAVPEESVAPAAPVRATRASAPGSKRTLDDLPAKAAALARAVEDRLPNGEDTAASVLEACAKHKGTGPHLWIFVGAPGCGKKHLASTIGSWMDAQVATMSGDEVKLAGESLYIANNPSPKLISAINQLMLDRSDCNNPWSQKTIFAVIDHPIDAKNIAGSCKQALVTMGTAVAELANPIPVLPPQSDAQWTKLAALLIESRRGMNSNDLLESAAKAVGYAKEINSVMSVENLLIAIQKV